MQRLRRLAALLAATVACLALSASASASDFVGVVSDDVFVGDASYRASELAAQKRAGVRLHRRLFDWSEIERVRGVYDFSAYDSYVAAAAQHGIRVLPILFNPPGFHSARPSRDARPGTYPPKSYASLGRFGAAVARRYGRTGSFWRENRSVRKLVITSYQVWNEPSLRAYWASGPSPRKYARMLRAVAPQIKRADRRAEIVTAGVPDSRLGSSINGFYRGLYKAGAKRYFDTVAVNPYASSSKSLTTKLRSIRRVMNAAGDRKARIWITELGWASGGPGKSAFKTTSAGQARRITQALSAVRRLRKSLRLRGVVYYAWKDGRPYAPHFRDFWGLHTGLTRLDGSAKPSLRAFSRGAKRLR